MEGGPTVDVIGMEGGILTGNDVDIGGGRPPVVVPNGFPPIEWYPSEGYPCCIVSNGFAMDETA